MEAFSVLQLVLLVVSNNNNNNNTEKQHLNTFASQ